MSTSSPTAEFQNLVRDHASHLLKIRECVVLSLKLNERLPQVIGDSVIKDLPVIRGSLLEWQNLLHLEDSEYFRTLAEDLDDILSENLDDVQVPDPDDVVSRVLSRFPSWQTILSVRQDGTPCREEIVSHLLDLFLEREGELQSRDQLHDAFLDDIWLWSERLSTESIVSGFRAREELDRYFMSRKRRSSFEDDSDDVFFMIAFAFHGSDLFDNLRKFSFDAMKRYVILTLLLRFDSFIE